MAAPNITSGDAFEFVLGGSLNVAVNESDAPAIWTVTDADGLDIYYPDDSPETVNTLTVVDTIPTVGTYHPVIRATNPDAPGEFSEQTLTVVVVAGSTFRPWFVQRVEY